MKEHTFAFVPALLTLDAASHYMGLSRRMIEEYVAKGDLKRTHMPRPNGEEGYVDRILIRREEADRFIEDQENKK